jgi:acyl-CoA reductase-like NAD-dependent aldehyde dehydrogenase
VTDRDQVADVHTAVRAFDAARAWQKLPPDERQVVLDHLRTSPTHAARAAVDVLMALGASA